MASLPTHVGLVDMSQTRQHRSPFITPRVGRGWVCVVCVRGVGREIVVTTQRRLGLFT